MQSIVGVVVIATDNAPNVFITICGLGTGAHLILHSRHIALLPPVDSGWEIRHPHGWHKSITSRAVGAAVISVVQFGKFSTILWEHIEQI